LHPFFIRPSSVRSQASRKVQAPFCIIGRILYFVWRDFVHCPSGHSSLSYESPTGKRDKRYTFFY
jgi:hypothetical protein